MLDDAPSPWAVLVWFTPGIPGYWSLHLSHTTWSNGPFFTITALASDFPLCSWDHTLLPQHLTHETDIFHDKVIVVGLAFPYHGVQLESLGAILNRVE